MKRFFMVNLLYCQYMNILVAKTLNLKRENITVWEEGLIFDLLEDNTIRATE